MKTIYKKWIFRIYVSLLEGMFNMEIQWARIGRRCDASDTKLQASLQFGRAKMTLLIKSSPLSDTKKSDGLSDIYSDTLSDILPFYLA